jgi:glycosyltransferase involved in cell wall biosynthesis
MNKPLLALVITDSSRTGGPRQVSYLAQALSGRYDIHCICPTGWLADELNDASVTIHLLENPANRRTVIDQLKELFRIIQPQIIHCHGVRAGILGLLAAHPHHPHLVYTEHLWTNDYHLTNRWREKVQLFLLGKTMRKADRVIAVSKATQTFIRDKRLVDDNKIQVIYGGIRPLRPAPKLTESVIGNLASLNRMKATDILLRALPQVIADYPKLRCRIGGTGPLEQPLKALAQKLGIEKQLEWLGPVVNTQDFFDSLQVYIHPSWNESFGLAIAEAQSAGLPVIAAQAGATPEIIENGKTGLLFTKNNSDDLASKILRLLADPALRQQLGKTAQDQAKTFTIDRFAEQHDQLYQELLRPTVSR